MTKIKEIKSPQYFEPYKLWIYNNAELDSRFNHIRVSDIDTYIQNYRTGRFLLLEWKCRGKSIQCPQSEIIQTIHTALKNSRDTRYSGYICVRLSGERPDDSSEIYLSGELILNGETRLFNDKKITEAELTKLLKLDWN